jgi:hypothetical protein
VIRHDMNVNIYDRLQLLPPFAKARVSLARAN